MIENEARELRDHIRTMWQQGADTVSMSRALLLPEAQIERELHAVLETRRSNELADAK